MRSCEVPKGGAKREGGRPALVPSGTSNTPSPLPRLREERCAAWVRGRGSGRGGGGREDGTCKMRCCKHKKPVFLVSLRAAEGGEAISALMRRAGTRRSRRPFWPPRRDTATCWPNLFTEVVFHALSARCTKVRPACREMASTEENVVSQGQPNSGEFSVCVKFEGR